MKNKTYFQTSFLLFFFTASSLFSPHLLAQCDPVSDSLALVAFYHATGGENWLDNSNWLVMGQGVETWYGVLVNDNGCVEELNLVSNNLVGELSENIGELTHLKVLNLERHKLTGQLPIEIGSLSNLVFLDLSTIHGHLSGSIHAITTLSNLLKLDFSGNSFSGNIPSGISNLVNLTELYLGYNQFSGNIPSELSDLGSLLRLDMDFNYFSGGIPSSFGDFQHLAYLSLNECHLTGSIPVELGNLVSLEELSLLSNNLTGSIPAEIGQLSNLKKINLSGNELTGILPPELGELLNLEVFLLISTMITGAIPAEFGELSNLKTLNLNYNELTGNIPPELGNLNNLESILLINNNLQGSIPAELGNLSSLRQLNFRGNNLDGNIPSEIGSLSNLIRLNLSRNQLTGGIPLEIGSLLNLGELDLSKNQLAGSIPPEIGNLSNLTALLLNDNQIGGEIPPEIGNLIQLDEIYLQHNDLEGSIPSALENIFYLSTLNVSNNNLSGLIPSSLADISFLHFLYLSDNNFSGQIPIELGSIFQLVDLDLSNNDLSGEIPIEIWASPILRYLNLSNNSLSGIINHQIINTGFLRYLYLNNNQLTGKLPIELSNLTSILKISLADNQLYGCFPPQYSTFCSIDSTNFSDNPGLPNGGDFDAFCETGAGACDPTITGQVTFDENQNCTIDSLEIGLQQWMIKARSPNGDLYGISDTSGHYNIYTYPEEYLVEVIPPGPYWEENCTGIVTVNIMDSLDLDTINFFPNVLVECPFMTVDISTPFLRRCFANTYVVNYCNGGTAPAEDASIAIQFDELINIDSASIAISTQLDNVLTFDLGNVAANECGSFFIYTNVSCDSELGQTLCATAHIYPDSICAEISPEWSGATVEVDGTCEGDEVTFIIKNTGIGDMQQDETYIVIEDGLILFAEPVPFILNSDGDLEVSFPANGSTYICQATQVENHPVPSMPTAFVEACGTNEDGDFSTGFVTQFPEDDNAPFISVDCQEVVGSFDPNDKNGYPKGYSEEHFIEKGQDIEYHIRFQNTGTDTTFTVVVEDVISPNLEMTSLRLGASSHPYSVEILGSDTLKFIFENILLADSTTNELASHGFVKFKISQKPDLGLGTTIENQAAIFFDFNEPVLTNTTLHTIGENFVQTTATNESFIPNLKVSLAPNPVINEAIIHISGIEFKNAQLSLFNTLGILLREETFNGNEFLLKRGDLPAGIYLFEIKVDRQKGFVGKMVVN